jgi:phage terminase Nu1 subunit (DNA packaging protein)
MPDNISQTWIVDTSQMAELLGVGDRHIRKMAQDGMPKVKRGQYHAPTVIQWYLGNKTADGDTRDQRTKLYAAQTEKIETETAKLQETLLDADVVASEMMELATRAATGLDALEPRLSAALGLDIDQRTKLRLEIKATREMIARDVETHADNRDSRKDHPTAA